MYQQHQQNIQFLFIISEMYCYKKCIDAIFIGGGANILRAINIQRNGSVHKTYKNWYVNWRANGSVQLM